MNMPGVVLDADFVTEKQRRGFRVRVATEADFGGAGVLGPDKGLLINGVFVAGLIFAVLLGFRV